MSDRSPTDTDAYLTALVERLRSVLDEALVGVYAGGSLALGGFDPVRSDVDVAVVCHGPLSEETKLRVAEALRHESLPCPARGLELVVYPEATARSATAAAGYEVNLDTGRGMQFHLSLAPGAGEAEHWYAIDRAIVREHGRTLFGPPAREVFAPIPGRTLLELLAESVRWHAESGRARPDDAVLNACRGLRYAAEGVWSSKQDAAVWARERLPDGALAADALAARSGFGQGLEDVRAERFLAEAQRSLEEAAREATPPRDA